MSSGGEREGGRGKEEPAYFQGRKFGLLQVSETNLEIESVFVSANFQSKNPRLDNDDAVRTQSV